jgi:PKD repeat protein
MATKLGNTVSSTFPVTINANIPPTCSIIKNALGGNKYQLISSCSDSDGRIMSMSWDLGGGAKSSASRATVEFKQPGVYPITLTATDDSGASVVVNDTIIVN